MLKTVSALAVAVAAIPATPAPAAQAQAPPAARRAGAPARVADIGGDFTEPGVRIRATPRLNGRVRGLGNPGDRYTWNGGQSFADPVTCSNGDVKDHWTYLINNRTRVQGYVSDCFVKEDPRRRSGLGTREGR
ncbi:hypothetical protein [Actinomadura citrea]|uniref:SH3 domain-containing protein n=1 Tax=Actinomadura citrea TaxID=46158 RepID=A0A7Y9KGG0_9ACTN|nr:hypothetical protein [Actinomadura citrea]NYE16431.1 hypothetical protein [Actinomadura citrea]GGT95037.1 hypothetical protein GCM10010177_62580 [Actinomadura citrea]